MASTDSVRPRPAVEALDGPREIDTWDGTPTLHNVQHPTRRRLKAPPCLMEVYPQCIARPEPHQSRGADREGSEGSEELEEYWGVTGVLLGDRVRAARSGCRLDGVRTGVQIRRAARVCVLGWIKKDNRYSPLTHHPDRQTKGRPSPHTAASPAPLSTLLLSHSWLFTLRRSASNDGSVGVRGAGRDTSTLSSHPTSGVSRLLSHFAFALTGGPPIWVWIIDIVGVVPTDAIYLFIVRSFVDGRLCCSVAVCGHATARLCI
ncbi:hypothetical protein AB1N83_005145 [Pleurotus pulmonarius]